MNYHVVTIDISDQECTLAPIDLQVNIGDSVIFQNLTKGRVIVFFPNGDLFGQNTCEIDPDKKSSVTVGNVAFDSYPYTVYCDCVDRFSNRAARPRIIVFRKIS